jgi:hypothetical protein
MKRRWMWSVAALVLCIAFIAFIVFSQGEQPLEFLNGHKSVQLSAADVVISGEGGQSGQAYSFKSDFKTVVAQARYELTKRGYEDVTKRIGARPVLSAYFVRGDVRGYVAASATLNLKPGDVDVVVLHRDFGFRADGNRLVGIGEPGNVSVFLLRARGPSLLGRLRSWVGL